MNSPLFSAAIHTIGCRKEGIFMGYSGNVGNYNNNCYYRGYDNGYSGSTFVLIVVLFILLIIVGATFMRGQY